MTDRETEEVLDELKEFYNAGKPFFMQMEPHSPYDGCWYEPNIFLVTPIGCEMQEELMLDIPPRYSAKREALAKRAQEAQSAAYSATHDYDILFEKSRGDWYIGDIEATAEEVSEAFDVMQINNQHADEAEAEPEAVCKTDPTPISQPQLIVWPLYASGQGVAMNAVHSLGELIEVCEEESVSALAQRDTWPHGLRGDRLDCDKTWGRISLVAVADATEPLNTALPAGERYWMHALQVAEEQWSQNFTWKCEGCDTVIEYDECEGRPEPTGYHGDGGIGVHYTGVLCDQCLQDGACQHCETASGDPMQYYDPAIKEHGWCLCEWCTQKLLESIELTGPEGIELPETVCITWHGDKNQLSLPDIRPGKKLVALDKDDKPIEGVQFNSIKLMEVAADMDLECFDRNYGHGIWLGGSYVEDAMETLEE